MEELAGLSSEFNNTRTRFWVKDPVINKVDIDEFLIEFYKSLIFRSYEDLNMKEKIIVHSLKSAGNIDIISWYNQQTS